MKTYLPSGLIILLLYISAATGCKKSIDSVSTDPVSVQHDTTMTAVNTTVHPYPITPVSECVYSPYYGDSIVYPQPATGNFYVYPLNTQGIQGTYLAWPGGLMLNSSTGVINVTQSQTGQRYDVAFIQYGTTDTCISHLVVAGTAYMDSVYVLSQNAVNAVPYFNANPSVPSPCGTNTNGNGCQFDYNKFARNQGIEINDKSGIINLNKTLNKAFGKNPLNGTALNTTIFYKLNDNSNNAPQQIPLRLIYYNRKSDIPPALLATVTTRRLSTISNQLLSKGPSTRPPLIIIVRFN